jgi:Xaa-Pro aminopeptidase
MSRVARGVAKVCAPFLLSAAAIVAPGWRASAGQIVMRESGRAAPRAPVWDDRERLTELAGRRARVAEFVGAKSLLVLLGGEPRVYAGDVDYKFRQENNLFYLTHLNQPGVTLVLLPGHTKHREVLFIPRRNPAAEAWTGKGLSAEDARALSGVGEIWEAGEFEPFMRAVRQGRAFKPRAESILLSANATVVAGGAVATTAATTNAQTATPVVQSQQTGYETLLAAIAQDEASIFLLLPSEAASREFRREQELAGRWAQTDTGLTVRSAWPVFTRLRQVKSPAEIKLIQHAVEITGEAIVGAAVVAGRAPREYEVEAEIEYAFRRLGAEGWGYPSIVGCGANATTLHYTAAGGACAPGDLMLLDVGAEFGHYSADVTRTLPVSGRFTPAQAELYNAVFAAQEAGLRAAKPGATLSDVHHAAADSMRDSLLKLGLITERNSTQYGIWFSHGTSHWLGLNVHDVGQQGRKLEPGMVFTVEPGIYVRADALEQLAKKPEMSKFVEAVRPAFEKYKNIGIRIEDDVVITADGHRNLSASIPRTLADVESLMGRVTR